MDIKEIIQDGSVELKKIDKDGEVLLSIVSEIKKSRKIALFWGNCQIDFLENEILQLEAFKNEYVIVRNSSVDLLSEKERREGFHIDLLNEVDLFIYQDLHDVKKYGELISTKIIQHLNKKCKKLCIPNCFFQGYHPQVIKNDRNTLFHSKYNEAGVVPYGDSILQQCFDANMDIGALEMYLYSDDCLSESKINENLIVAFEELNRRELGCDVIISDYIKANYLEKYLFYTPSHPANIVLNELARRILNKLGYDTKEFIYKENEKENNCFEVLIYPIVKKILGLKFDKEIFYFCRTLWPYRDTLLGYALKYRKYCFPELGTERIGNRSVDMTYNIKLNTDCVKERLASCMTYYNGTVHLALYLTALKAVPNAVIACIEDSLAPKKSYLTTAYSVKDNYPIHILANGEIKMNKPDDKQCVIMIDTIWHI